MSVYMIAVKMVYFCEWFHYAEVRRVKELLVFERLSDSEGGKESATCLKIYSLLIHGAVIRSISQSGWAIVEVQDGESASEDGVL